MTTYEELQKELDNKLKQLEAEEERLGQEYSNQVREWLHSELVKIQKEFSLNEISIIFGMGTYCFEFKDSSDNTYDTYSEHEASNAIRQIDEQLTDLLDDKLNYMLDIKVVKQGK